MIALSGVDIETSLARETMSVSNLRTPDCSGLIRPFPSFTAHPAHLGKITDNFRMHLWGF